MLKRTHCASPAALLAMISLCSCVSGTHALRVNESYVAERSIAVGGKISGTGAVYTTRADDNYIFKGGAASSIGRQAQLEIPIGAMSKKIAAQVFSRKFANGCIQTNSETAAARHAVTVYPRISAYSYKIRMALSGFNLVPQVEMTLSVDVRNKQQNVIFSKKIHSGLINGESFWGSHRGAEAVNKITHETIFNLMQEAARSLEDMLREAR